MPTGSHGGLLPEGEAIDEAAKGKTPELAPAADLGTRTLLAAALIGAGGMLFAAALGVVRTKLLAITLEPSGLGIYAQVLALLTALSAASGLGLGLGTTKVVAEARETNAPKQIERALSVSLAVPLAIGLALGVLMAVTSPLAAPLLLDTSRVLLLLLAAAAVPIIAIQGPLVHAIQGFRDVEGAQKSNALFAVALTGATAAGALALGLDGAVLALVAGNAVYTLVLTARLAWLTRGIGSRLTLRGGFRRDRLRDPVIRSMLGIGFASLLVAVAAGLGDVGVRTLLLHTTGAAAAGVFQGLMLISNQIIGVIVVAVTKPPAVKIPKGHCEHGTRTLAIDQ